MEPPRKHKSSGIPVKEEVKLEDGNDLLVKRRRTELPGSIVQLKQEIEVFDMENKAPDGLPVQDSTGKDPMDVLTICAAQNSVQGNGCSNEPASSRLTKICKTIGWKEPSYDFEEQGPPHNRMMAQFHLLDPHYDEHHRGRLTAEGQVLPVLRSRTHDRFLDMRYDDRYTPLLERAGLDVVSFQVRRGLPTINSAAITALVDRWRPETHTFHLPCGEMTVTLRDIQKQLGLSIRGRPVTGQAAPGGWRQRVEAFLGREVPLDTPGSHTSGVSLAWLKQSFRECPAAADDQTVSYYCRAWVLHLFGSVLFPDATGDSASWMFLPCLTDWDTAGGYSWASAVLSFLYRHLCEACRRTAKNASLGGCVYLLQLWMWSHLPVGRPTEFAPRPWFDVAGLRLRPTAAYRWDQVQAPFARHQRAYVEYSNELDALTPSMVSWQPYDVPSLTHIQLSSACTADEDIYLLRCPLICFYAIEYHLPHRVARQFGLRQEFPVEPFSTSVELHKFDRQKQKKVTDFEAHHRVYIDEWDQMQDLYQNEQPHTNYNFRQYISWYVGATRCKLKVQWTAADYAELGSSDDEDTSYDLVTRHGTHVEAAPILYRVGNSMMQSVVDIECFSRTTSDSRTLAFLSRLSRRLRRAAARCGCRTSTGVDAQHTLQRHADTSLGRVASTAAQSSSCLTQDMFASHEDEGGDDDVDVPHDKIGLSQLHDAPTTQPSHPTPSRR